MNPTPPPTTSASIAVSPTGSANGTFGPITGGFTGSATIPAASTNATLTTTFSASAPSGTPQLQSVQRRPANIGASAITPLAFVTITSNATVSFATAPSFTFTPPSGVTATLASLSYVAEYDPTNPSAGWTTILGPATLQGSSLFFDSGSSTAITLAAGKTYSFVLFTVPQALPVPSPTPTPLTCASTARQGAAHLAATYPGASWVVPNQLAVTYRASAASRAPQSIDRTVNSVHTLDLGIMSGNGHRVLTLAPGTDMTAATATLRKSSDVLAVDPVHYRRPSSYPNVTTLNSDDGVNDPFSDNVDQWYLYKTGTNPTAWQTSKSASNISIAIIDTGVDETNKDFVFDVRESVVNGVKTTGNGAAQDTDGHGTNVAGLAAAQANNSLGFAGVAYNAHVQAYKIFADDSTSNPCPSANTADEAQAINDAVSNHASVISLSLGSPQSGGSDATEQAAIENAIAAGVTVVAANGNEYPSSDGNQPDYPAAYPGVIAVGASAVADDNVGNAYTAITSETVASYSNSSPTLLAPGGDASGSASDSDPLHWITGYYTTTPGVPGNSCTGKDGICVALFNGTSQATPQVSGAIALMIAEHGSPMAPATVKSILTSTADLLPGIPASRQGAGRLNVAKAVAASK